MTLLFFAHGKKEFLNEVLFAVLSYFQHHHIDENQILIYTDQVSFFQGKLPASVRYISVKKDTIKRWLGAIDFVHRVKIEVIKDAFKRFPNETILYLDSDVFFKENISFLAEKIENDTPVMSINEGRIFKSKLKHFKKLASFLKINHYKIPLKNPIAVSLEQNMYNAGIIGIRNNPEILEKALEITDLMQPHLHLHITEQFAFSLLLASSEKVYEAEKHIHHYWYFKEFRDIIQDFFEKNKDISFEELVLRSKKINPEEMGSEKRAYKAMNFFQKLYKQITKFRKWEIKTPNDF